MPRSLAPAEPCCLICGRSYRVRPDYRGSPRLTCSRRCSLDLWNVFTARSISTARRQLCRTYPDAPAHLAAALVDYASARLARKAVRRLLANLVKKRIVRDH
jgi:hypothetical protein